MSKSGNAGVGAIPSRARVSRQQRPAALPQQPSEAWQEWFAATQQRTLQLDVSDTSMFSVGGTVMDPRPQRESR